MSEATAGTVSPHAEAADAPIVSPGPAAGPAGPEALRSRAAELLRVRGVGPVALIGFALSFAGAAAFVFLLDHPGLGGVLGLIALLAAEVALAPPVRETRETNDLVRGLSPVVDLAMVAGLVGGMAHRVAPIVLALALAVLVLMAWLPLLKERGGPGRMAGTSSLWSRGERMAVLLAGAALGRLGPALLVLLLVSALDAWLRVERLAQPAGFRPQIGWKSARRVLRPDGSFVPAVHWGTLAVTLILLVALPQGAGWRF